MRGFHRPVMIGVIAALLWMAFLARDADAAPPNKYLLSGGRVYESKPAQPEWVFILGGTGPTRGGEIVCQSPATLKALLKGLPRGSTLDWWPTCAGESEALAGHLDDLKKNCSEAGIEFTIHPSG